MSTSVQQPYPRPLLVLGVSSKIVSCVLNYLSQFSQVVYNAPETQEQTSPGPISSIQSILDMPRGVTTLFKRGLPILSIAQSDSHFIEKLMKLLYASENGKTESSVTQSGYLAEGGSFDTDIHSILPFKPLLIIVVCDPRLDIEQNYPDILLNDKIVDPALLNQLESDYRQMFDIAEQYQNSEKGMVIRLEDLEIRDSLENKYFIDQLGFDYEANKETQHALISGKLNRKNNACLDEWIIKRFSADFVKWRYPLFAPSPLTQLIKTRENEIQGWEDLEARISDCRDMAKELHHIHLLEEELHHLEAYEEELDRNINNWKMELKNIKNSLSWKGTAFLRSGMDMLLMIKGKRQP